eukprot:UN27744
MKDCKYATFMHTAIHLYVIMWVLFVSFLLVTCYILYISKTHNYTI